MEKDECGTKENHLEQVCRLDRAKCGQHCTAFQGFIGCTICIWSLRDRVMCGGMFSAEIRTK